MQPIEVEGMNVVLKAQGCKDVPACFDPDVKRMAICWQLSDDDIAAIQQEKCLWMILATDKPTMQPVYFQFDSPLIKKVIEDDLPLFQGPQLTKNIGD